MNTYWVVGRQGYSKPLPDFDDLSKEDEPRPRKTSQCLIRPQKFHKISQESGFSETMILEDSLDNTNNVNNNVSTAFEEHPVVMEDNYVTDTKKNEPIQVIHITPPTPSTEHPFVLDGEDLTDIMSVGSSSSW